MVKTYFWILYLLKVGLKAPYTDANRKFLLSWWAWEGGNGGRFENISSSAQWNWLNTMTPWPGSTRFNAVGVQNYPSWLAGCQATTKTIQNGKYPDIISALKSGSPLSHWPAVGLSTWVSGKDSPVGRAYSERVRLLTISQHL